MSMNRFVGLGIFALSSSVLLTMSACDDSATAPGITGNGGTPNTTSASRNNTDEDTGTDDDTDTATSKASTTKASTTKASTTKTGTGGTSGKATTTKKTTVADGGAENTDTSDAEGGTTGTGGDVATEVECILGETDIMPIAAATDTGNWIGGIDDQTADNPCGIQGAFYAYSDTGADGANGGGDDSLSEPAWLEGSTYDNPCKDGKCCIKGTTVEWPEASGGEIDYSMNWGAGLGFSLGDGGESSPGKSAYEGSAKGFRFTLEGDLAGGQTVRIMFTQSATDENAPFVPYTSLGEKEVLFEDVSCPSWATDCTDTGYGGPNPYDLQIQVAGGDDAGDFEVCLTNLVPIE